MSSKILGSLSPVYGLMSGKGAFGKLADSGLGGIIPSALAADRRKRKEKEESEGRSGRGMVGRPTGKSGLEEPEEGAPATGRPRLGGMMGRVPMSAFNSKSMRGASTQGMKSGGKVKNYRDGGIYTADMGQPPQDIDGGSASMKKPMPKKPEDKKPAPKLRGEGARKIPVPPKKEKMYAKGGSIDGCAQRGKTNCKMR